MSLTFVQHGLPLIVAFLNRVCHISGGSGTAEERTKERQCGHRPEYCSPGKGCDDSLRR